MIFEPQESFMATQTKIFQLEVEHKTKHTWTCLMWLPAKSFPQVMILYQKGMAYLAKFYEEYLQQQQQFR